MVKIVYQTRALFGSGDNMQLWIDEMVKGKNHLLESVSDMDGIEPGQSENVTSSSYITATSQE